MGGTEAVKFVRHAFEVLAKIRAAKGKPHSEALAGISTAH